MTLKPRLRVNRWRIFFLAFYFASVFSSTVAANVLAVKEWNGEFFKKKEGGLFVKTNVTDFPRAVTSNVQITLYGIIQQQSYTFSNTQVALSSPPREIWKFPSGKYRVDRIELVDHAGVKRTWLANQSSPMAVIVPRIMLSNLGLWTLKPAGASGLSVKFQMVANSYSEKGLPAESSVAAVVNGFTGSIQKVIGGKQVIEGADRDYSDDKTLRATATFTRQIGMYYKVDMFKHNRFAKDIMAAISAFDPKIRECYTRALNQDGSLKGELVFQVIASAKTGTIRQARKSKGSISNGSMIDCISDELMQIPMPVQENMLGELTFIFEVK